MNRRIRLALFAFALIACGSTIAPAADKKNDGSARQRKYQTRDRDAEARPADSSSTAAEGPGYEQELQVAKEDRDRKLDEAAQQETDRERLEKRKGEIFSQYARIVAALRDKYKEQQARTPAATDPPAAEDAPPKKGSRYRRSPEPADEPDRTPASARRGKNKDRDAGSTRGSLEDAQRELDEENARHQAKLDELNGQLRDAEAANNRRDVRKFQKAIEKENNTYEAKKSVLERRLRDAGGAPAKGEPAR